MNIPDNLKYTKDHEWVKVEGSTATMGITEFAQGELGEIVFVELPTTGKALKQGESACVVESTKAASDVYAPVSGSVKDVNVALADTPSLVNQQPYTTGWMLKLEGINPAELSGLMSAKEYAQHLQQK